MQLPETESPQTRSTNNGEEPMLLQESGSFPIIGIGSSAGGLEALEIFLRNVPPDSGMAFVIVQHLDPTRKAMMVELLQHATSMQVKQVKDGMKVEPNRVYLIPPNKDMSLLHCVLHLLDPIAPRGLRLPIDYFFRSLADDLQERSIGVILSGMGSDGTLGLRSIKEKAGGVFVQEPSTAKFDGMPRSAIEAGLADVVAPVDDLPGKIVAYMQHALRIPEAEPLAGKAQTALEKITILLRAKTGHDFSLYKKSTLYRRIERRMGIHQIEKISDYVRFLQKNPQEVELLFKELLIGVTNFFRDPAAWTFLKEKAIPMLLANRRPGRPLRAWIPGCSTGEEAYSLAMIFKEALEEMDPSEYFQLLIFATDLDRDAVDKARIGFYPTNIAADVSPERLRRFFIQEEHGYRVGKEIREMVIFAPQNIIMDPPFTKLDILSCRNLLIYLNTEVQKKLIPLFHYSLNPDGILFLGNAETIGTFTDLFTVVDNKARVYRRLPTVLTAEPVEFPSSFSPLQPYMPGEYPAPKPLVNLQAKAEQIILNHFAPPTVLVNDKGDILYVSGRTGKYLELAVGKANWNIFAMAREGLLYELTQAFHKALRQKEAITLKEVKVRTNGGYQNVDVTVKSLEEPEELRGMVMVVFADVPTTAEGKDSVKAKQTTGRSAHLVELQKDLQRTQEELRTTREEMQTSQEELKSANEELQSVNEELQSNNEELTSSKEEMQSLNEELQTVNNEMNAKLNELSRMNDDMKNLLNSTDIATLFLDNNLKVRRFTNPVAKLINLIPTDMGRPITHITSELVYPNMADEAQEVLRSLVFVEKEIATRDGRWFLTKIMPYRTMDNMIDGVVITFVETTAHKKIESQLREEVRRLQQELRDMQAIRGNSK